MKKWMVPSLLVIVFAFLISYFSGYLVKDENMDRASVIHVIDGDTVKVRVNGQTENVRLLLVDTPETNLPSGDVQPYGLEATDFAEEILDDEQILLEYDGPKRDRYDRLLAYIWIEDQLFNQMLVEEGYARVAYIYDPPYTHYEQLIEAEKKSRVEQKRIWSMEGYVTEEGFIEN